MSGWKRSSRGRITSDAAPGTAGSRRRARPQGRAAQRRRCGAGAPTALFVHGSRHLWLRLISCLAKQHSAPLLCLPTQFLEPAPKPAKGRGRAGQPSWLPGGARQRLRQQEGSAGRAPRSLHGARAGVHGSQEKRLGDLRPSPGAAPLSGSRCQPSNSGSTTNFRTQPCPPTGNSKSGWQKKANVVICESC